MNVNDTVWNYLDNAIWMMFDGKPDELAEFLRAKADEVEAAFDELLDELMEEEEEEAA